MKKPIKTYGVGVDSKKGAIEQICEHFAKAYTTLAYQAYVGRDQDAAIALRHFECGLYLAGFDINPYLPPECPKI